MSDEVLKRALDLYGLSGNPFSLSPLDPLKDSNDISLVASVDGWTRLDQLKSYIESSVDETDGGLLIISGTSGTGRSSLINYAINVWRERRGLSAENTVTVPWAVDTFDAGDEVWKWAQKIRTRLIKAKIVASPGAQEELKSLRTKPDAVEMVVRELLHTLVLDLAAKDAGLVGVIENVKEVRLLSSVIEARQYADMLMILTIDKTYATAHSLLVEVGQIVSEHGGFHIALSEISGTEVCSLVNTRWGFYASPGQPAPFDMAGIEEAFLDPPRSLKRALSLLEHLLLLRLDTSTGSGSPLPHLSADEIKLKISYMDRSFLGRM